MATKITSYQRVKEVMALLLTGMMRGEIVEQKMKEWNCSDTNVDKYIHKAKEQFKEHWDQYLKEETLSKHNMLFNQSLQNFDRREARENLKEISKLAGHVVEKRETKYSIDMPTKIIIDPIDGED